MKLGVIILAHRLPAQLGRLVSVLDHPQVALYVHVDARTRLEPFAGALGDSAAVTLLPRHAGHWGGPDILDATLAGMGHAVRDRCDYVLLVSGQDFPLRPMSEIVSFFEQADERSYMSYWPLPTERWRYQGRDRTDFYSYTVLGRRETCIPRGEDVSSFSMRGRALNTLLRARTAGKPSRRFPAYLQPFGGHVWWNLSRAAARHVLEFVRAHPDYRAYHQYSVCPDEVFFQSIVMGTGFGDQHEVVNDALRYWNWPPGTTSPSVLGVADLPTALASGQLFARKFDSEVDTAVLDRLTDRVRG